MKNRNRVFDLFLRYFILVLVAIPSLWLFYMVFTPLTTYPVYWLLNIFYDASLLNNNIVLIKNELSIELTKACIAGSAYYLFSILNLSTPGIRTKKRIRMLFLAFASFLLVNILRIFILSILAITDSAFFDISHRIFWYALSTVFVAAIWFAEVRSFKIKEIPFYSDIKFLYRNMK